MKEYDVDMESILKRFALWGGIALAIISIYFSWDGADQTLGNANSQYDSIAQLIMIVLAFVVTLAQFIFNSDFSKLSTTMRVIGVASYAYSLVTNYLGINHLFGFEGILGGIISGFMDIAPEAFIAWSLDDSMRGDMLGNLGKIVTGVGSSKSGRGHSRHDNRPANQYQADTRRQEPVTQPKMPSITDKKGRDRRSFLEDQYRNKRNDKPSPEASKRGLYESEKPNRFSGFGE